MIKKVVVSALLLFTIYYLLFPVPGFPPPPHGSLVSGEPADTESIHRKAYYTNLSREQIINYYKTQWRWPFIRLIIPPEDAQTVIRDQTRSSWLEEFVHPIKDSLYVNGFYPSKPTEQINIDGVHYQAKITLHYTPSHPITRLTLLALASSSVYLLVKEYAKI